MKSADDKVGIELDIPEEELIRYLQFAKNRGMTFNELVEQAVKEMLIKEEFNAFYAAWYDRELLARCLNGRGHNVLNTYTIDN